MIVKPCDVVASDRLSDQLVVVSTRIDRLYASIILPEDKLASAGTYLPANLGNLSIIGCWDPEKIAAGEADGLFSGEPALREKFYGIFLKSIHDAIATDKPYQCEATIRAD